MRKLKIYQVDAFTNQLFSGNPAAVCLLDKWISDDVMQAIGGENNLAETAFVVPHGEEFEIRWFTPTVEVDLCGHATLGAAYVLFEVLNYAGDTIRFHSPKSGPLAVTKAHDFFYLDFPTDTLIELPSSESLIIANCLGVNPLKLYKGKTDYIAILDCEASVQHVKPNLAAIAQLHARGLIVSAPGNEVDFVSRFFAPQSGVDEDPVTGSAHTSLIPIWAKQLGKNNLRAAQLSTRGGQLFCELKNDRCQIGGNAKLYLEGEIYLD